MKARFLLKAILTLVISCPFSVLAQPKAENKTDEKGRKQGYWEKIDPATKKPIYKGTFKDDKPQGLFVYYHPGTDSVSTRSDFRKDGSIAYMQMFHLVSGKIKAKGKYLNEQKDSTWNFYDEEGKLLSTEGYKEGKKHGVSKIFFQDGKLSEEKNYKNGILDGPFKMLFDDKTIKAEGKYVNGEYEGLCAWYFPTGHAAAKGIYTLGKKKGVWIYKDKDGKITGKEVWDNGKQLTDKEAAEYLKKNNVKEPAESKGAAGKDKKSPKQGKK